MPDYTVADVAGMLDHSLLPPTLTDAAMAADCRRARDYGFASICAKPCFLPECVALLRGSSVRPTTVIGFPHGVQTTALKVTEIEQAGAAGAIEVDAVVNIGKVLSGDWQYVETELAALVRTAHQRRLAIKIIFENCYLTDDQKRRLCQVCGELQADFVKTSTGFGTGGATLADVRLMRQCSPPTVQVKAAGGVKTLDALLEMRAAGATRIGCSTSFAIVEACRDRLRG